MSIDFHWISIDFITFSAPEYFKPFENQPTINDFTIIDLFWATLSNIGQHWSTLVNIGHHRSPLIHTGHPWSTLINIKIKQHWPILIANDQHWSTLINTDQHRWTLINTLNIDQHWSTLSNMANTDQHWSSLMNIDWTCHPIPFHPIPSTMRASKALQSPHRLLKAAEPLEAFISSRNLTHYKKFNFASKPKFVNQVWPFNTPHPFNPPVLQSSNHPVILVWEGGMRVAIE